jgi:hypothetical protein
LQLRVAAKKAVKDRASRKIETTLGVGLRKEQHDNMSEIIDVDFYCQLSLCISIVILFTA